MAIFIEIDLVGETGDAKLFEFHRSDGTSYGVLGVELDTLTFALLESRSDGCETFAYPRACRAIREASLKGAIPDRLCYTA
jgi:hypothetical protein